MSSRTPAGLEAAPPTSPRFDGHPRSRLSPHRGRAVVPADRGGRAGRRRGRLDVAAPFEVYASSLAARTVPIAAGNTVTTRHGLRLFAIPAGTTAPRINRLVVPGVRGIEAVDSQLVRWAEERGLVVELPQGSKDAGEFGFDAMLRDLAAYIDRTTAHVTAKSIEYPSDHLRLAGAGWPWRPTALFAFTVAAAIGVGLIPAAAARRDRR